MDGVVRVVMTTDGEEFMIMEDICWTPALVRLVAVLSPFFPPLIMPTAAAILVKCVELSQAAQVCFSTRAVST